MEKRGDVTRRSDETERDGGQDEGAGISRRDFVVRTGATVGAVAACGTLSMFCSDDDGAPDAGQRDSGADGPGGDAAAGSPAPVVIIAIDALHPRYLSLDAKGAAGGSDGNWLMPNLNALLEEGGRFADARCHLPAATDMNHLNVVAGTNTGQTGVNFVGTLPTGWKSDRTIKLSPPHLGMARDGKGRQVETLLQLWAKKWPKSRTAFISGKGWIADMYSKDDTLGIDPGIDVIVQGGKEPSYVPKAINYKHSFYDPPGDADAKCDPESAMAKAFDDGIYKKDDKALNHFPPRPVGGGRHAQGARE